MPSSIAAIQKPGARFVCGNLKHRGHQAFPRPPGNAARPTRSTAPRRGATSSRSAGSTCQRSLSSGHMRQTIWATRPARESGQKGRLHGAFYYHRSVNNVLSFARPAPKRDQVIGHMGSGQCCDLSVIEGRRDLDHIGPNQVDPRQAAQQKPRLMPWSSPPQTGVPVPGAKAGSRASISKVR